MLSKEEYKKQLVRMWDILRDDKYKGEETCEGVHCSKCSFDEICNAEGGSAIIDAFKSIEIVENWAKENPIQTNADKFREVFDMEKLPFYSCIYTNADCKDCEHFIGMGCIANSSFWNAEYEPTKEGEE